MEISLKHTQPKKKFKRQEIETNVIDKVDTLKYLLTMTSNTVLTHTLNFFDPRNLH